MSTYITRAGKGSALTHTELDTRSKQAAQTKAAAYTIAESDNRDTVEYSGAGTEAFTLPDAATVVAAADTGDFEVTVKHVGTGTLTVDRTTGADTIEGTAADITLETNAWVTLKVNQAGDGYLVIAGAYTGSTFTSPVLNTGVSGTAVLDDDTMATATATTLASSESIKAYADNVIQVLESASAAYTSTTATIAYTDTAPTSASGSEQVTQAITPKYSTSKLEVSFDMTVAHTTANANIVALLIDKTGTSVLRAFTQQQTFATNALTHMSGSVLIASPGTSANTYALNIGTDLGATLYTNGISSGRKYGGTLAIRLTVKEIT